MTFGANVKLRREVLGLSLSELAQAGGCSRSYLWVIEQERSVPTIDKAAKIAQALGVTLDQLVGTSAPVKPDGDGPSYYELATENAHLRGVLNKIMRLLAKE